MSKNIILLLPWRHTSTGQTMSNDSWNLPQDDSFHGAHKREEKNNTWLFNPFLNTQKAFSLGPRELGMKNKTYFVEEKSFRKSRSTEGDILRLQKAAWYLYTWTVQLGQKTAALASSPAIIWPKLLA